MNSAPAIILCAALAAVTACADGRGAGAPAPQPLPAPAGGRSVPPGGLQDALTEAAAGAVLLLEPGLHPGPIRITRPVTIWGPPTAILRSTGEGTTLSVEAAGTKLSGFTVDGSGSRFDTTDAAVRVRADDVEVRGLSVVHSLFGILVELSKRAEIRDNLVEGTGQPAHGLRGDGIRLWETTDSVVSGNRVRDARDVVVWYSSHNRVVGNDVRGCRYGTHFMYSHENLVADNRYRDNVVGIFVMYSHDVSIERNLIAHCSGAAGVGLGVKESGNLTVAANAFLANTTSIYLDTSPLDRNQTNRFRGNHIRMSDAGVVFHASPERNEFEDNSLRDNTHQVQVGGGGDAMRTSWRGNCWDDYQGYDLDGDGRGDVAYELRSLSSDLLGKQPELALLRGTPALAMVDLVGEVLPLFAPQQLLVDESPRLVSSPLEWFDAH